LLAGLGVGRAERLVKQEGYRYVRSWFRMRGELNGRPPAPEWPEIPSVAAVCVYPSPVALAPGALHGPGVRPASVATGLLAGPASLPAKLRDPADPVAAMEALGAAFRALVSGLRMTLIARSAIKGEFRIEQTMIRARGNNPLKFSADDDDALTALLGTGRRTGMGPEEAVADALRDMRLHELATIAAMQEAMRALLARLDPAGVADAGGRGRVASQRKARAWDAYEKLHAATVQALADDFDSVFGKAFARAYEQALREAAGRDGRG